WCACGGGGGVCVRGASPAGMDAGGGVHGCRGEPPRVDHRATSAWWVRLCCGRELMRCRSAGVWGSPGLPRDVPFEGLDYARPAVTRSNSPGFANATSHYANPGTTPGNNLHAVSEYDIACYQTGQTH